MTTETYVDSTFLISLVFTDGATPPTYLDPSAIALVIKDPAGTVKATKAIGDLTHDSLGHYHYQYDTVSTDIVGTWRAICTASIGGLDEVSVGTCDVEAQTPASTTLFRATAAMVKESFFTDLTDFTIETILARKEKWVTKKTGIVATPADPDLSILQEAVVFETRLEIITKYPHSLGDGGDRQEHYPQIDYRSRLKEIYAEYPLITTVYSRQTTHETDDIKTTWNET